VDCPEILGCAPQGDTVEEALSMIKDAIKGCLEVISEKERLAKVS
jgi:predicted RNase H-like HicB family nuclease